MKKIRKAFITTLTLVVILGLSGSISLAAVPPGGVELGTVSNFAIFADDAVSDAAPTGSIIGDVGLTPTTGFAITGLTCAQVTGTIYDVDGAYADACEVVNAGLLTTADNDLSTAYNFAEVQVPLPDIATELGGQNLTPGVYHSAAGTFTISGGTTLTLDGGGNPDAVFIFQTDSTLDTVGAANSVVLANGTQACNVFWKVGSSATFDTATTFIGTVMAAVSITDAGGSTITGRLLADADETDVPETGAVSLNNTDVTVPSCAAYVPPSSGGGSSSSSGSRRTRTPPPVVEEVINNEEVIVPVVPPVPVPGFPVTGFPPEDNKSIVPITVLASIFVTSILIYFAQKKQTS